MATHGSVAVVKLGDAANTVTDITAYVDTTGLPRSVDSVETTTLGATQKTYIPGLKDGTLPLSGPFDPTIDALLDGILRKAGRLFEFYPIGNTGGAGTNVKYAGAGIVTKYDISTPVSGRADFSADFQQSGNTARSLV
jgi:hypothetical protein